MNDIEKKLDSADGSMQKMTRCNYFNDKYGKYIGEALVYFLLFGISIFMIVFASINLAKYYNCDPNYVYMSNSSIINDYTYTIDMMPNKDISYISIYSNHVFYANFSYDGEDNILYPCVFGFDNYSYISDNYYTNASNNQIRIIFYNDTNNITVAYDIIL